MGRMTPVTVQEDVDTFSNNSVALNSPTDGNVSDGLSSGKLGNSEEDVRRANHNALERRRREYQKEKLHELKCVVPTISNDKPSTVEVLSKSAKYILHLSEIQMEQNKELLTLTKDINELGLKVQKVTGEKLVIPPDILAIMSICLERKTTKTGLGESKKKKSSSTSSNVSVKSKEETVSVKSEKPKGRKPSLKSRNSICETLPTISFDTDLDPSDPHVVPSQISHSDKEAEAVNALKQLASLDVRVPRDRSKRKSESDTKPLLKRSNSKFQGDLPENLESPPLEAEPDKSSKSSHLVQDRSMEVDLLTSFCESIHRRHSMSSVDYKQFSDMHINEYVDADGKIISPPVPLQPEAGIESHDETGPYLDDRRRTRHQSFLSESGEKMDYCSPQEFNVRGYPRYHVEYSAYPPRVSEAPNYSYMYPHYMNPSFSPSMPHPPHEMYSNAPAGYVYHSFPSNPVGGPPAPFRQPLLNRHPFPQRHSYSEYGYPDASRLPSNYPPYESYPPGSVCDDANGACHNASAGGKSGYLNNSCSSIKASEQAVVPEIRTMSNSPQGAVTGSAMGHSCSPDASAQGSQKETLSTVVSASACKPFESNLNGSLTDVKSLDRVHSTGYLEI